MTPEASLTNALLTVTGASLLSAIPAAEWTSAFTIESFVMLAEPTDPEGKLTVPPDTVRPLLKVPLAALKAPALLTEASNVLVLSLNSSKFAV
jgi:hypothetical protein